MSTKTRKVPAAGAVVLLLVMALAATVPAASAQTGPGCTSITSDFNGTSIAQGNWIWFNAHIDLKSPASDRLTVYFTQQTITFSWGSVTVPDGEIVYSSSVSNPSTTYYAAGTGPNPPADGSDYWYTVVPVSQGGDIFISGLAYKVTQPAGTNYNPVVWSGCFSVSGSSSCAFSLQWQWGAAVYTTFAYPAPGTNNLGVTSTQANGLQSGTPTNYERYVIGGARGGGGANYTGSWSGTASVSTTCYCSGNSCTTTPPPPPPLCSSSSSATLTVNSVTLSGAPLSGMEMDLSDCMGNPYAATFTPGGIILGTGVMYTVVADLYSGPCTFAYWDTGHLSGTFDFAGAAGPSFTNIDVKIAGDTSLTAVYNCGPAPGSFAVVQTLDQSGNVIYGHYIQLFDSNGLEVNDAFSRATFQVTPGTIYTAQANGYGSCSFLSWQDGNTNSMETFTATPATTTLTATYFCAQA